VVAVLAIGALHSFSMLLTGHHVVPVLLVEFAYSLFNALLFSVFCLLNQASVTFMSHSK
jgi:hypothetical protein